MLSKLQLVFPVILVGLYALGCLQLLEGPFYLSASRMEQ